MGFVSKKRGSVIYSAVYRLRRSRKADMTHEIYFLMFQFIMVFLVVIALFQFVNNVASDLTFEKKFTAVDLGLLSTAVMYAPGTLKHTYRPLDFPVPVDIIFANSLLNVQERGQELNMFYWYLSDMGLDPIEATVNLNIVDPEDPIAASSDFTYFRAGRQIAFSREETNPLQLVCPVVNTSADDWQSRKIFIARVLPNAEAYANASLPVNRIAQVIAARHSQVVVSSPQTGPVSAAGADLISAIPEDAKIVIAIGYAADEREPGSLVVYVPLEKNIMPARKLACFMINDLLTPESSVFYSQVMPVYMTGIGEETPLNIFNEMSSDDQVMVFLDIAGFTEDQIEIDNTANAIYRAVERYYGGYDIAGVTGSTLSFTPSALGSVAGAGAAGIDVSALQPGGAGGAGGARTPGAAAGDYGAGLVPDRQGEGNKVVVYLSDESGDREFKNRGNRMGGAIGATTYSAMTANDILEAIRRHEGIGTLIIAGHGSSTSLLRPGTAGIRVGPDALPRWVSVETFARELAPRLAPGAIISLAGCSAGSNPGEDGEPVQKMGPGGERSFAGKLRDALVQSGAPEGIEIRSHTTAGHLSANPYARVFRTGASQVGQPGASVMDEVWGSGAHTTRWREWVDAFRGDNAERWMSGQPAAIV